MDSYTVAQFPQGGFMSIYELYMRTVAAISQVPPKALDPMTIESMAKIARFAERLYGPMPPAVGVKEAEERKTKAPRVEGRPAQTKRPVKRRLEESPEKMQIVAGVFRTMPKSSKTAQAVEIAYVAKVSPSSAKRWLKAFEGLPPERKKLYMAG